MSKFIKINNWHIDLFEIIAVKKEIDYLPDCEDEPINFIILHTKGGGTTVIDFEKSKVKCNLEYDKLIKMLERKEKGEEALVVRYIKKDEFDSTVMCVDYIKRDDKNSKYIYKPVYENKEYELFEKDLYYIYINNEEGYQRDMSDW